MKSCGYALGVVAVVAGLLAGQGFGSLAAQSVNLPAQGRVIAEDSRLNLRTGPGVDFAIAGKVDPQTAVEVLALSDDGVWYQVRVAGVGTGWVAAEFVALTDSSPEGAALLLPTPTPTPGGVRAPRVGVAALIAPTTSAPAAASIANSVASPITNTADADAGAAVPTAVPTVLPTPVPTFDVPTAIVQPARMNVRGGPGTSFPVVAGVNGGTALAITGANPAADWYRVQLEGADENAWVFGALVLLAGPTDGIVTLAQEELPVAPTPAPEAVQAAAAAPPIVSAPPPSGGGAFGYGVQAHMLTGETGPSMGAISDMGFNWVKQQVEWKLFQPSPGPIGFGDLANIVNEAGARGINVLFSVVNAPAWAREPGFDGNVGGPPVDPNTYAAFVGSMASQFCGTSLKAIEVWNEQNLHYEWGNKPLDPAEYMQLLKVSYAAIKRECPSMMVISGALTPAGDNPPFARDDFAYLEGMYQNGLRDFADGIGAHPSGYNVPPSVTWEGACAAIQQSGNSFNGACDTPHHSWSFRSTMEGYRNIMNVYGDSAKRVWPTEFGWAAGGAFNPAYAYANDNSFDEQAAWTVEAYTMMRNWGWVGPAFLWNLNFRVVADGTEKAQWGIVGNDWQPLPVYNALKTMAK
jgi:uncharacterized protein YgiM (DUF1202 family)